MQKQLTTKGWQAVAAACQSYHCISSSTSQTPFSALKNINKLRAKDFHLFKKMSSIRNFGVVQRIPTEFAFAAEITYVEIASLEKKVGEFVEVDEVVAELAIDKVQISICSEHAGVITKYFAEEGETCRVGDRLFEIDTDAKAPAVDVAPPTAEAPAATDAPQP